MIRKNPILVISIMLVILFAYAAISKLPDYSSFKYMLSRLPLIDNKASIAAIVLLTTELWIATLLFLPSTRLWGLYGSAALMIVFTLYIGYVIFFSSWIPNPDLFKVRFAAFAMTWKQALVFTIFFLVVSLTGIVLHRKWVQKVKERELPPVIFT